MTEKQQRALALAKSKAERFVRLAKAALDRQASDDEELLYLCYTKEGAAAKRASMDLSRALSAYRQAGRGSSGN